MTYTLTAGVVGAPQMTSLPVSCIFLCSPLPSRIWQTPGLSIPRCCPPTSFSVLSSPPFHCTLQDVFLPDLVNGRHVHTISICVSLRWSGLRMIRLLAGSWHRLPCWQHGLCVRCEVSSGSTSFPWLVFFFAALL